MSLNKISNKSHIINFVKNNTTGAIIIWVGFGALTGGLYSGFHKALSICNEPDRVYKIPIIERPITFFYQASRIAFYFGLGSFIGGFTALTAPISLPYYVWWKDKTE